MAKAIPEVGDPALGWQEPLGHIGCTNPVTKGFAKLLRSCSRCSPRLPPCVVAPPSHLLPPPPFGMLVSPSDDLSGSSSLEVIRCNLAAVLSVFATVLS